MVGSEVRRVSRGLKPDERLRVAFAHLCLGVDQHALAAVFGVNPGRVAEAVALAREAFAFPETVPARAAKLVQREK